MAVLLVQFTDPVLDADGGRYVARACGSPMDDGRWQGWVEFLPEDGGDPIRSGRETTQPNYVDTEYWATGLTQVYLDGALNRALNLCKPLMAPPEEEAAPPLAESVLNPFSVYRKGETLLRNQLGALSQWHLANIVYAHRLSDADPAALHHMPANALIEIIVAGVQQQMTA